MTRAIALILGGGAMKGAFEAGVLDELLRRPVTVRRIVAVSTGALNGVALAAGVRAHRTEEAVADIVGAWEREGGIEGIISLDWRGILGLRGLSNRKKLLALLRRHVKPSTSSCGARVELHTVLAPLRGVQGHLDGEPATTYAQTQRFADDDFDTPERLDRVFLTATASAALPVLFVPVDVPGLGPCCDGGLVNNLPILSAFGADQGRSLDAVVVVTPSPAHVPAPAEEYRGLALVGHQMDMVFGEWQYQYLRRCMMLEEALVELDAAVVQHGFLRDTVESVKAKLGLFVARPVPIVSIRPVDPLPGGMLSALFDPALRRLYVETGRARARHVLDRLGWR